MLTQIHSYKFSGYKSLWTDGKMFYIASTIDGSFSQLETMVFHSDQEGEVTNWADLYVTYENQSHNDTMKEFEEVLKSKMETKDGT